MIPADCFAIPGIALHYNDTNGLLRTSCSRNPTKYSHKSGTGVPLLCSYFGGPQILIHAYEQAHACIRAWDPGIIKFLLIHKRMGFAAGEKEV